MSNLYECTSRLEIVIGTNVCHSPTEGDRHNACQSDRHTVCHSILKDHLKDQKTQERPPAVEAAAAREVHYTRQPGDEEKFIEASKRLPWRHKTGEGSDERV